MPEKIQNCDDHRMPLVTFLVKCQTSDAYYEEAVLWRNFLWLSWKISFTLEARNSTSGASNNKIMTAMGSSNICANGNNWNAWKSRYSLWYEGEKWGWYKRRYSIIIKSIDWLFTVIFRWFLQTRSAPRYQKAMAWKRFRLYTVSIGVIGIFW